MIISSDSLFLNGLAARRFLYNPVALAFGHQEALFRLGVIHFAMVTYMTSGSTGLAM
jgi:hypothetical protein